MPLTSSIGSGSMVKRDMSGAEGGGGTTHHGLVFGCALWGVQQWVFILWRQVTMGVQMLRGRQLALQV